MSIGARVKAIMVGMVLLKTKLTMALTKIDLPYCPRLAALATALSLVKKVAL